MFAAIFILGIIIYAILSIIKGTKEDYYGRKEYKHSKSNSYLAHDLVYRDLDTGKPRFFHREDHDIVMTGEDIGKVNLSQTERDEEFCRLKANPNPNKTTCFYEYTPQVHKYGSILGNRYKDLETEEIFVVRENNKKSFYVGLNDQKVKRYTDSQKRRGTQNESKDVIEFQRKIDEARNDYYWRNKDFTMVGCPGANIKGLIDTWEN